MDGTGDSKPKNADLEKLLEEKARLESLIQETFTKQITVMFTDLKGSTALADSQGDIVARQLIKKHNDILFPVIQNSRGTLVKTMGDGTMSYFVEADDAVQAAALIQKKIHDYNLSRGGFEPIRVRIGINSGRGMVEGDDIFGDVVNVASRFESLAAPGEIYISEDTYNLLQKKSEIYCRHIKNATLKGKSEESKVFKVFWNPEEIRRDKVEMSLASRNVLDVTEDKGLSSDIRPMLRRSAISGRFAGRAPGSIPENKKAVSEIKDEIEGCTVEAGQTFRKSGDSYRVLGDIIIKKNALMSLENVNLYFVADSGIVVLGAIRAKNCFFGAADPAGKWNNITILQEAEGTSLLENCKFHFGSGRHWRSLKNFADLSNPCARDDSSYGGGLFVAGSTENTLLIKKCTFHMCSSHCGGGIFFHKSRIIVDDCDFDGCSSPSSGGGISAFTSNLTARNCTFNKCMAGTEGGGIYCSSSRMSIEKSLFRNCMGRYYGGGVACISSIPSIKQCKFERCTSTKSGGGIYGDKKSKAKLSFSSFLDCKPNDTDLIL